MRRARAARSRWTSPTQVFHVFRGKTRGGAGFYCALPVFAHPAAPLLARLDEEICQAFGEQFADEFFIPDVVVCAQGTFVRLLPRNMTYTKFTAVLNKFVADAARGEEVPPVSSYACRRFLPSAALALQLEEDELDSIGNWVDRAGAAGPRTRCAEPMSVRNSDARLERSSTAKRIVLAAFSHLFQHVKGPRHHHMVAMAQHTRTFRVLVQTKLWGVDISEAQSPVPQPVLPMESFLEGLGEVPAPASPSASSTSSSSSRGSSSARSPGLYDIEEIEWVAPKTKDGLVHLHDPDAAEIDAGKPLCRRTAFAWGFVAGRGRQDAAALGRRWCTACLARIGDLDIVHGLIGA